MHSQLPALPNIEMETFKLDVGGNLEGESSWFYNMAELRSHPGWFQYQKHWLDSENFLSLAMVGCAIRRDLVLLLLRGAMGRKYRKIFEVLFQGSGLDIAKGDLNI